MDEQSRISASREADKEEGAATSAAGAPPTGENRRGGRSNRHRGHSRPQHQPQSTSGSSLNMSELRELAELINNHGFTDFEFENENIRVRLRKELAPQIIQAISSPQQSVAPPQQQTQTGQPQNVEASITGNATTTGTEEAATLRKIVSPIVGTFYRAASPEAEPFVKVGSQVSSETTVCIVEAMKLMNEIPAETSGEIVKIYVENGQPVEYGQPLFAVK